VSIITKGCGDIMEIIFTINNFYIYTEKLLHPQKCNNNMHSEVEAVFYVLFYVLKISVNYDFTKYPVPS
jgi:hypothetical protein